MTSFCVQQERKGRNGFGVHHNDTEPCSSDGNGGHQHPLTLSPLFNSPIAKIPKPPTPVPDQLLHLLHTIRATINHLTRLQHSIDTTTTSSTIPPNLLLYSHLNPIASSCHNHPDLLHKYMSYTPFSLCPSDSDLAESLILYPFPSSLSDFSAIWDHYPCKSFDCFHRQNPNLGFNHSSDSSKFTTYKTDLDLPISQFFQIAKSAKSVIWLGLDVGGSTRSFAATMKLHNVTVVTMTMSGGAEGACATSRAAVAAAAGVRRSGGPCAVRACCEPVYSDDDDGVLAV
ncbi:uncharacterized protein DS421_13g390870 [Arachis hypogaea]|nr:uncharacterized protein DS421_13g390870 [Arachis hypogaea]